VKTSETPKTSRSKRAASGTAPERRRHDRVPATLAMQLGGLAEDGGALTTESINISEGGLYCRVRREIEPLTRVALTLVFPPAGRRTKPHLVKCSAIVVRCEPETAPRQRNFYSVACYFTDMSEADRTVVQQFVTWRTQRRG
jgi:c-di-GMP-binding flagellar brake protein YcgR